MSLATAANVTAHGPRRATARKTTGEQVKRSSAAEVIDHAAAAAQRRVQIGDPLLDLMERTRLGYLSAEAAEDEAVSDAIYDPLFEEQKNAPAATSMAGVLAALRYGISDIEGFDSCTGSVLRGALAGLERIVGSPKTDPAFRIIEEHRAAWTKWKAFGDHTPDEHPAFKAADKKEVACWERLIATTPTTIAGLGALLDYYDRAKLLQRACESGDAETILKALASAAPMICGVAASTTATDDPLLDKRRR
ncbi:hypothetical protein [Hansschlegelia sp.]|uniref:hypothetical protein n=1 Tax=Hansschlegelia sp. TaxID=2041892 RepID=UPI002CDEEA58|nr:hypothetical protein [Hansschlegelia sp.]HVI30419.1 hypothetical protein [Hansschlegelia sp.]